MKWASQAAPQTLDEVQRALRYPEIVTTARGRGITSIVHFTRITGLKGMLATSSIKARAYLPEDLRIRYVYEPNASDRSRDLPWHGYINLSVTSISLLMFEFSKREHPDDDWVILEFGPQVLGDPGVVFCTTNNVYEVAHRCAGPQGFEQMFAPTIPWGHYGSTSNRSRRASNQTTDPQAEVLYPFALLLDHLHTITVPDEAIYETVRAILYHFPNDPEIAIAPKAFQ